MTASSSQLTSLFVCVHAHVSVCLYMCVHFRICLLTRVWVCVPGYVSVCVHPCLASCQRKYESVQAVHVTEFLLKALPQALNK